MFANLSHMKAKAFLSRALTDHSNQALLRPTRISPDMSLQRPESIIQHDWLTLLEGMILACPAPYNAVAQGHCGKGVGGCYPGPVNTRNLDEGNDDWLTKSQYLVG